MAGGIRVDRRLPLPGAGSAFAPTNSVPSRLSSPSGDVYDLKIARPQHGHFSDLTLFFPRDTTQLEPSRAHEIITACTVAFFDRYLKGMESTLLEGASRRFDEVVFDRKTATRRVAVPHNATPEEVMTDGTRGAHGTCGRGVSVLLATVASLTFASSPILAQTDGTCVPVAERAGRAFGCFITARQELGRLPTDSALYWHLETYPTNAAASSARASRSTVVESLGRVWLFTIAPAEWRPRGGTHVARIGPLPLIAADSFAAVYMEGTFQPGMNTVVHRHPGAEAWYTLEGTMCVETPDGMLTQSAGEPGVVVTGGLPMMLTGTGTGPRRSVVLILQDATQPRSTHAADWTPRGLCRR